MRWCLPLIGLALSLQTSLAFAAPAAGLLARLKLPLPKPAAPLFAANGLGQTSLNTQLSASPEDLLTKLKTELTAQGYKERQINTVVGAWGFNLVMEPPGGTSVDGTPADKVALLVAQAAAIAPGRLNLNLRFEASGR
jgi:hypothetical protein